MKIKSFAAFYFGEQARGAGKINGNNDMTTMEN